MRKITWAVSVVSCLLMAGAIAPIIGAEAVVDANNVVIVLDGSGSMGDAMKGSGTQRMEAAKQGLLEVLKQIPADTHVGLVVFSASLPDPWVYPLGARDDVRLEAAIRSVTPAGGTPLGEYIQMGATRLLAQRQAQHGYGTFRLLVVTDGEATDQERVDRYAPEVVARGITMDVIGVDMQETHSLATRAHSYRSANDPESLKKAVAEVFAEISAADGGAAGHEAFDEIASLPPEMAIDMIETLSSSGNHPIGQPAPTAPAADGSPGAVAGKPGTGSSPPAPSHPDRPGSGGDSSSLVALSAIVVFCVFLVLTSIGGSRKGKR